MYRQLSRAWYAAVETRIRIGWNNFRQLVPVRTNKDVSLIMRGRLYSSCVRSSMLYGSETSSVRKENVVALQRTEMRMVRWMCGIKLKRYTFTVYKIFLTTVFPFLLQDWLHGFSGLTVSTQSVCPFWESYQLQTWWELSTWGSTRVVYFLGQ